MRIRCPKCHVVFEPGAPNAAGVFECPQCGQRLKGTPSAPKAKPQAGAEPLAPVRLSGRATAKPSRLPGKAGRRPGRAPAPPRKARSPGLIIGIVAASVVVLSMAGVFIYMGVSRRGPTPPTPVTPPVAPPTQPTTPTGDPVQPTPPDPAPPSSSVGLPITAATDLEPSALFAKASPAVCRIDVMNAAYKKQSQGSGFLVSPDGLVVTNYHVMHVGLRGLVRFGDSKTFPVTAVLAQDKEKDLAVLKIAGKGLPYLEVLRRGEKPTVGTRAFAIGTPSGYTNTLSEGLVSGLREQENRSVVQTTAEIGSGSSGGPLLDARGRVLGVNTFVRVQRHGHTVVENLNFSVANDEIHDIMDEAIKARSKVKATEGKPLDDTAASEFARAYELMGKEKLLEAAGIVETLAKQYPQSMQVRLLQARISMRMNFMDEALKAFQAAARLNPNESEPHVGIGLAHKRKKAYAKAADAFQKAVNLNPADPSAQCELGVVLLKLDRNDEALTALKEAVQLEDKDPKAWMALGDAYLAEKLYSPAADAFQKSISLRPTQALAFARLALAHYHNEHYDQAVAAASTAIQMRRDLPEAYYVMGLLLKHSGQKKKLRQVRDILEQLNPEMAAKLAKELAAQGDDDKTTKPSEATVKEIPDFNEMPAPKKKPDEDKDEDEDEDEG